MKATRRDFLATAATAAGAAAAGDLARTRKIRNTVTPMRTRRFLRTWPCE